MKKTFALLLAALMLLGILAGCNGGGTTAATTTPAAVSGTTANGSSAIVDTNDVDTTVSEEYEYRMPITDGYTLSYWTTFSSTVIDGQADKKCYQEMEKRTGVHIDWQQATSSNSGEAFNLMVMSGDYTDLINAGQGTYSGGMDKAIEDGVYLRLNEYVTKWAPNFLAMMNRNDATRRQQLTDQGNIAYFGSIQNPQPAWCGTMLRQDWLEADGLATPVTYDDWHKMLVSFRDNHGAVLFLGSGGYDSMTQSTNAGFDVGVEFYNESGTIKYGFVEEGFRDYLTLMHQWYTEGLIDQDFYTRNAPAFPDVDLIVNGTFGVFEHLGSLQPMFKMVSRNDEFATRGLAAPVKNVGDVAHFRRVNFELGTAGAVITPGVADDMEKLEIAVRWMDYHYTDEGSILLNYGIQGESWEYDENGEPQLTDLIMHDPDGLSSTDALSKYGDIQGGQWYRWERENKSSPEVYLEAQQIWDQADGAWVLPPITLTTAEGQEYSNLYGDIQTFATESIPAFITGAKPLSDWDSFVAQIKSMGIDRCIELQQAALDRYNNR